MAEFINKESAISIFRAKAEMATCTPAQPYFYKAVKMLELLPAADVEPVVRCEFCLYRSQYPDKDGFYKCGGVSTDGVAMMVSPDFYCKHGERRCRDGGGTAL